MMRSGSDSLGDRLGRPLRDLRVSVTDNCNFRCSYCMPADLFSDGHPFLPPDRLLSHEEIVRVVKLATELGVRKVKLTGGEPLQRPGLGALIEELASVSGLEDLGLITNGFHLEQQAEELYRRGLRRITISLDSLREERFASITGRAGALAQVMKGIDAARAAGFSPIKINMVVQRDVNSDELLDMVRHFRGSGMILRFIEYMDVGSRHEYRKSLLVPSAEILEKINAEYPLEALEPTVYGEVASRYAYADGAGEIGFISSMTQPFCGNCTRLRLSADGTMYRCLFSGIGLGLRPLLKAGAGDEELGERISRFWGLREDRYSELRSQGGQDGAGGSRKAGASRKAASAAEAAAGKIEMYRMGG